MIDDLFSKVWGVKETRYSGIIGQTFGLSASFNSFFQERLGIQDKAIEIVSVETEKSLGELGQIDIFLNYDNGLVVGMENKKWAGLRPQQLIRYDEALKIESKDNYKLVFLAPSTYSLRDNEKPDFLIIIRYKEIIDWINSLAVKDDFESNYLQYLLKYIEVLEMSPLNEGEIRSLLYYAKSIKKLDAILSDLREENEGTIENNANYKLFYRNIDNILTYTGFRFGTDWYYNDALINNLPECIIYIKDIWSDNKEKTVQNEKIKTIYEILRGDTDLNTIILNYYEPVSKKDECRVAIRTSLSDFEGKDISEIINWFRVMFEKLKEANNKIMNSPN